MQDKNSLCAQEDYSRFKDHAAYLQIKLDGVMDENEKLRTTSREVKEELAHVKRYNDLIEDEIKGLNLINQKNQSQIQQFKQFRHITHFGEKSKRKFVDKKTQTKNLEIQITNIDSNQAQLQGFDQSKAFTDFNASIKLNDKAESKIFVYGSCDKSRSYGDIHSNNPKSFNPSNEKSQISQSPFNMAASGSKMTKNNNSYEDNSEPHQDQASMISKKVNYNQNDNKLVKSVTQRYRISKQERLSNKLSSIKCLSPLNNETTFQTDQIGIDVELQQILMLIKKIMKFQLSDKKIESTQII